MDNTVYHACLHYNPIEVITPYVSKSEHTRS